MVPRGLEPRTLRLLAVRSNQLSYETSCEQVACCSYCFFLGKAAASSRKLFDVPERNTFKHLYMEALGAGYFLL